MLRYLAALLTFALLAAYTSIDEAAQPAAAADPCIAQIRNGQSKFIECYGEFETDADAQAELSRQTFDMVRMARCGGTIRIVRAALMSALITNGMLELDPQEVLCTITTSGDAESQVSITIAPKVLFQAGKILDISPRLMRISNLPDLLVAPLRSAAESEFVRGQLTSGLNAYLEQALRK